MRAGVLAIVSVALAGCAGPRIAAPVFDRAPPSRPAPAAPAQTVPAPDGFYVVKRGDTLYSIALEHGADYREVAQWNSLDDPTKINVGQTLRVRPPEERRTPQSPQIGAARVPERIESRPLDKAIPEKKAAPQTEVAGFVWPAKGKVLAGFAEPRSKGIDIDGRPGDPIVAAAAGRVTYTGSGIPGLGKLVVIKHDNGFITVYAHNREILVKEQQAVARGEKIAELGATDAERPKLHFQIRKGSAPVDPMRYLPGL